MTPLSQTVLAVLDAEPVSTDEILHTVNARADDIVDALESLRKAGLVEHAMLGSASVWSRKEKLLIERTT